MTTEPARPRPQDFESPAAYEVAMNEYLAGIADPHQSVEDGAMDAFRQWREHPPEDGWERATKGTTT